MKNNTETIDEIIFANFPSNPTKGKQTGLFYTSLRKRALSFKAQFFSGMATLGIGTVLLIAVYLFFIQLAEYGWQ
ncbi:MAG: hypothetical protein WBB19_11260 [Desulforhopalus sp.]